jgi:hypothetical protein
MLAEEWAVKVQMATIQRMAENQINVRRRVEVGKRRD